MAQHAQRNNRITSFSVFVTNYHATFGSVSFKSAHLPNGPLDGLEHGQLPSLVDLLEPERGREHVAGLGRHVNLKKYAYNDNELGKRAMTSLKPRTYFTPGR